MKDLPSLAALHFAMERAGTDQREAVLHKLAQGHRAPFHDLIAFAYYIDETVFKEKMT